MMPARGSSLSAIARNVERTASRTMIGGTRRAYLIPKARTYASESQAHAKPPLYGQPISTTHPHLIKSNADLTRGIPASEYETRRRKLMQSLPEGSKVICMGGTVRLVTQHLVSTSSGRDEATRLMERYRHLLSYKFRQSTDFFYLTGFNEPDSVLVLESKPSSSRGYTYTLYVPAKDAHEEQWEGARTGPDAAVSIFGADAAHPNSTFASHLSEMVNNVPKGQLYVQLPPSPSPSPYSSPYPPTETGVSTKRKVSSLGKLLSGSNMFTTPLSPPHIALHQLLAASTALPLAPEVEKLRFVKSPTELALMKRAGEISSEAHTRVMRTTAKRIASGHETTEGMLAAEFEYHCAMAGSERPAYVPVVASGANACVIHYTQNDQVLKKDELVLIDAGCEFSHYASDITRTFPVSGKFSDPQRDLYQAVLNVQKACIERCQIADEIGMNELHRISCRLLTEELKQIGFKLHVGDVERMLYPHYISHHLGSDLHDCATNNRNGHLVEGNVITIEPGCYVPASNSFPKAFQGIGIRIEDAVAFTKDGPLNLSATAPKEIVDVEGVCLGSLEAR